MAFDACMLAATLSEIREKALGARIEKVYQPERDEIILQMRSFEGGKRLQINAGSGNARIGFTKVQKENPQNPPMFCMLLRKYLQGAKLCEVEQEPFDRIAYLGFDTYDEMGFPCKRYLIAELMGKYSNLIFADENKKMISAMRASELSFDSVRQLVFGMEYAPPSKGDKKDPTSTDKESFIAAFDSAPPERPADKFIVENFSGIAPVVAREIVYRATNHTDTPIKYCFSDQLFSEFSKVMDRIREARFEPTMVLDGDRPVEYCFMPISQYGGLETKTFAAISELFDAYFEARDREQRVHQRAADILKLLNNAEARIQRKLEAQKRELRDCEKGSEYKKYGDMITANIYRLSRSDRVVEFDDYEDMREDGSFGKIRVELDNRLSPAANAQRYYKKYNKAKTAKIELSKQIALGEAELEYLTTVFEALDRAENPSDLLEIRDELYRSGYASRMKTYSARKAHNPVVMQFETPDGMRVLCGKNNVQNEYITHKLASKLDYWFHARQKAGSHVLLVTDGHEPTDLDFTTAAEIAAYYSKAEGDNIAVDYTLAKNVKKPAGGKPGLVIYHTNWTAYVTPDGEKLAKLRKTK